MAKIYSYFSKQLIIELPSFYFMSVSEQILNSVAILTADERILIEKSLVESQNIVRICLDSDEEVLKYHETYSDRCVERMLRSLESEEKETFKKKRRHGLSLVS
jgi:hypothetical protein